MDKFRLIGEQTLSFGIGQRIKCVPGSGHDCGEGGVLCGAANEGFFNLAKGGVNVKKSMLIQHSFWLKTLFANYADYLTGKIIKRPELFLAFAGDVTN